MICHFATILNFTHLTDYKACVEVVNFRQVRQFVPMFFSSDWSNKRWLSENKTAIDNHFFTA
jgi:hypothetical protein